jgi:hypothetical protein
MNNPLKHQLETLFPNKVVIGLSSKDASLYRYIKIAAERNNQDWKEYVKGLGFTVERARSAQSQSNFDTRTVQRLLNSYSIRQTDISDWQGVTRQNVSDKLNRKVQGQSWVITDIQPEDKKIFEGMIQQKKFSTVENGASYMIFSNFHLGPCFIIIKDKKINVLFDVLKDWKILLHQTKMDIFDQIDFEIADNIEQVSILKEPHARPINDTISSLMRQQSAKREMTIDEYCKLHGFKGYADTRMITDEEVLEKLQKYVEEDGCVKLPSHAEDYHYFTSRASRNNMTLEELLSLLGYNHIDTRLESNTKTKLEFYKKELEKLTIGNTNRLHLDIDSSLYLKMFAFARRRGTTLNEIIAELGFERVYRRGESTFEEQMKTVLDEQLDKKAIILEELQKIQGSLQVRSTTSERVVRNKQLVSKLKELYNHKCQLCTEDQPIPVIVTEDGLPYVEVHHIVPIGARNNIGVLEMEYENLDSYKNTIVVCPHHHRVLHYHKGGYHKLVEEEGQLYFVSQHGDRLKIVENEHLETPVSVKKNTKQPFVKLYRNKYIS